MVQLIDLAFVHFRHYAHVFAQPIIFLFEKSILFLKLNIPIKEFAGLFVVSGLGAWTLGQYAFYNAGFFGESESIGPDYFTRPLGGSLTQVPAGVRVPCCVVDAFRPVTEQVVVQEVRVIVVVQVAALFWFLLTQKHRLHVTDLVENQVFL